jgi:hypothetical protein
MSLRQRFVFLVCLAVVALGAAGLAIVQLRSRSAAAIESAASKASTEVVAIDLAELVDERLSQAEALAFPRQGAPRTGRRGHGVRAPRVALPRD